MMKIPLWARMMGMARRSQVCDLSGSMAAGGASLRASSATGTNAVAVSAGPVDAGRRSRVGSSGRLRLSREAAKACRQRSRPSKARRCRPRRPGRRSRQPGVDGHVGLGQHPVALGGQHVGDPTPVVLDRAALDQAPGHQAVDHGGDARRADGQALGQGRGQRPSSSSSPRIRYWGSDRSTETRPSSTCLASQAAVRPSVRHSSWTAVAPGVSSGFT